MHACTLLSQDSFSYSLPCFAFVSFQIGFVHSCVVNKVPFPALESFEDRIRFPKRYFIFFDVFVRAGRHNRTLWMQYIQRDKGQNDMRFGPAIFEAHVRTTIRENYFKWIFQQLSDIEDVTDEDVRKFQLEYDEDVYTELPKTLACTHKEVTKFPFEDYEIYYGRERPVVCPPRRKPDNSNPPEEIVARRTNEETHVQGGESDDDEEEDSGYCSATSISDGLRSLQSSPGTRSVNPASSPEGSAAPTGGEHEDHHKFYIVDQNVDKPRFKAIREKQRRDLRALIEEKRVEHKDILLSLKESVMFARREKRKNPTDEDDPKAREAIAEVKRNLRLFKDTGDVESSEGPAKKKYRRSMDNQTRLSDAKVSFFAKTSDAMRIEEKNGLRRSWEMLYKQIWNDVILAPKEPVFHSEPIPTVNDISRDLEDDVDQMLMDAMNAYEEV